MTAVDKVRALANLLPGALDNQRVTTPWENNHRTERFQVRVTGQVDITVAGTGLRNRGSILAAWPIFGFRDNNDEIVRVDARILRYMGEFWAPSPLPATRLANANIQAATLLNETFPIWLSAPKTVNPDETKYVEVNKQGLLEVFGFPNRAITQVATGATGTITNLVAAIEAVYDDLLGTPPWYNVYTVQQTVNVPGANPRLRVDLRTDDFIRAVFIQQDTDQGEVADIINSLVLRGDRKEVIGPDPVPFLDLQQQSALESGGALVPGYLGIDFIRYGRLTTMYNPDQDTNLRLELNVQPSAVVGATGSRVNVVMVTYRDTLATSRVKPVRP